jgi:thiol-disulfide isomerase/thioredoxin
MKKYLFIIIILYASELWAQNIPVKPGLTVKIGDKVPDVRINDLMNYPAKTARLSDFKGKVLILDFWDTWCTGCLENMPEMAKLKQEFANSVQFISVTDQSQSVINPFLQWNDQVRNLKLTIATGDKKLSALFPHRLVPHIVWINQEGVYLGATSQNDLNPEIINGILKTGVAEFSDPKTDILNFDPQKPLFVNGNGGQPKVLFKSILAAYQPGLPSQMQTLMNGGNERIMATNVAPYELYCKVFAISPYSLPPNRIIYTDTALSRIFRYQKGKSKSGSLFCYEIIFPAKSEKKMYQLIRNELDHWLSIHVTLENRLTDCYVLRSTGTHAKALLPDSLTIKNSGNSIKGQSIFTLTSLLNNQPDMKPVLDDSHLATKVTIALGSQLHGIKEINRALLPYGLTFREEKRNLKMMFVSPAVLPESPLTFHQ